MHVFARKQAPQPFTMLASGGADATASAHSG